jgi:PAS domain S-box-containing protein
MMDRLKLIDLTPDILCVSSFDGSFIFTNPAFENVLGYRSDEIKSINAFSIMHPDDLIGVRRSLIEARKEHKDTVKLEYRYLCKNGDYKWISWNIKLVWDEQLVYGAGRDITIRKNMEMEIIKAREEADNASKAKSLFLANISHEIRTPMNGILAAIQFLQSTIMSEEQNKYIKVLKESSSNLLAITNDLLDLSKIESGKFELSIEPFNLKEAISNIYNNLLITGNTKGLDISYYLDPKIDFKVIGDELRLKQILSNLISNAIKFTDEGYVSFRVKVLSSDDKTAKIEFRIKDSGIGIEESLRKRLFQSFSQGDLSVKKKYMGTGLGLAISKQLSKLMNGDICFESSVGQGSTFFFTCEFEKYQEIGLDIQKNKAQEKEVQVNRLKSNKAILCIEDNLINQEVLKSVIMQKGFKYIAAYNGNEALEILKNNKVDLILMDIQMPELNGFETTKAIREGKIGGRHIPIIAMTAYAMTEDKDKCIRAGMDDYISKPYDINELYKLFKIYLME